MKYRLENTIQGVSAFKASDTGAFTLTRDESLYLSQKLIFKDVETFTIHHRRLFCVYADTTTMYDIDKLDAAGSKFDGTASFDGIALNSAVFFDNVNIEELTLRYRLINLTTKEVIADFGRLSLPQSVLNTGDFVFFNLESHILAFTPQSQDCIWKYEVTEGGKISKLIDVWQSQLIVACSSHILLSVDVNTGKITHRWQELKGFEAGSFYKDVLPDPSSFVLDQTTNKLIGTFDVFYLEIDLITKQISYENIELELNRHDIIAFRRMGNNPFTDDHLFLIGHVRDEEMPDIDFNCVLALNRHTRKVDWHYTFKDTSIGTNVPQITDTHLYLRDAENNLYIFEKQ